jgi:hypothetical protein
VEVTQKTGIAVIKWIVVMIIEGYRFVFLLMINPCIPIAMLGIGIKPYSI